MDVLVCVCGRAGVCVDMVMGVVVWLIALLSCWLVVRCLLVCLLDRSGF